MQKTRIGIHKAGKPICFYKNADDHSAISIEVTRIIRILADHGHEVSILSDTDYITGTIKNVSKGTQGPLDKVLIYNGVSLTADIVENMLRLTDVVDLVVTDLGLLPDEKTMSLFSNVYSQSTHWQQYGAIHEHECYEYTPKRYKKYTQIYFGGTERGRTRDFFEYVYRPNVKWYGKSQTLGIKNYIPYHLHLQQMKAATYSIVIGDEAYNKVGFVTPRYYECIRYGIIPFVDVNYDPYETMISKNDFRRVSNYIEMMHKINELESNPQKYDMILTAQEKEITADQIAGHTIEKLLTSDK